MRMLALELSDLPRRAIGFNVHAARTPSQSLSGERLVLSPAVESQTHTDPATGNRYLRVYAAPAHAGALVRGDRRSDASPLRSDAARGSVSAP